MDSQRHKPVNFNRELVSVLVKTVKAFALPIGVIVGGSIGFAIALRAEAGPIDVMLWTLAGELAGGLTSLVIPAILGWLVEITLAAGIVVAFFAAVILAGRVL